MRCKSDQSKQKSFIIILYGVKIIDKKKIYVF